MAKVMIEGMIEGQRRRGRLPGQWEDDLKEWDGGWTMERTRSTARRGKSGRWLPTALMAMAQKTRPFPCNKRFKPDFDDKMR